MIIAILTSFALAQTPQADTVRLSLDAALARAREANPTLRAERADARAASALALQATRAFLPSVTLDAMGMRTTDPVAVFGLKLRQGAFQASDLALSALNDPAAYPGWSASATVEQPILAPEGLFGYAAARRGAAARNAGARRAAGATAYYVARTYWGAQLAAQRLRALDTALAAARAHVQQATALHEQGLVTGLDARLASLRASEVEARRLAAHADAENARSALATILALPDDASLVLTDSLDAPLPTPPCAGDTTCDVAHRGDVMALRLGAQALGLGVDRAWASQ
ncbi:MAG TPA: TolC family protein, partial [Gemmatimonadales bacterium]|nr:TolC family protein [Gemmatimonadales bacterium]